MLGPLKKLFGAWPPSMSTAQASLALCFKGPEEALAFACTIAPRLRPGLVCPAVIDDVERAGDFGPVARVRVATPEGPRPLIAAFPDKEDLLGATARITDLCAVTLSPDAPPQGTPDVLMVVAILKPEFHPDLGTWTECQRLGQGRGN